MQKSTLQLLRFPFSYFLMPVYWFALSFVETVSVPRAVLVFVILHGLVYPSSNGFNSYMDRDTDSIGGVAHPMQPTKELFYTTVVMDILAIGLSLLVSTTFAVCVFIYILFSRLYSYRGVRLKQYPVGGYLTVMLVQGAVTFFMIYHGCDANLTTHMPLLLLVAAAFLIGGFYPITQVYQHESDARDGVQTISMMVGKKGTFIFCAAMYGVAVLLLWLYYSSREHYGYLLVIMIFFAPVLFYFGKWFSEVVKDEAKADFKHTMTMNKLASTCTSLAFITITLLQRFG